MMGSLASMGLDIERIAGQAVAGGLRAYLNSLYPEEFEYYLFTLELLSRGGTVKEILIFPVMPNSISEDRPSLVNIKKTNNSVISVTNNTFAPTNISVSGTFGKKIRIILGNQDKTGEDSGSAFAFSEDVKIGGENVSIRGEVKTGYGITKLLERIIKRSQEEEDSLLFMFNLSLGNNYLVECTNLTLSQSMENNMMWNYQMQFKSLAEASKVYPGGVDKLQKSIKSQLKFSVINDTVFQMVRALEGVTAIANESGLKMGL